jgi:FixJ family two-component response regulator
VAKPLISIVDDDGSVRLALAGLARSLGFRTEMFASAEDFLASGSFNVARCVITDIQMPGLSGTELKYELDTRGCRVPVIMITGHVEKSLYEQARRSGVLCLLTKPFVAAALVEWVEKALAT